MLAIFKREFKAFFQSFIGWLFIGANLFLIGIYFFAYNISGAYPYFSYTLSACSFIYMLTIPILTMRILSEERKNKTDQLILTAPISVAKIVVGKFLAVSAVFAILMAVISTYPLIMSMFGEIPYVETYTALLGFALYGFTAAAIGVFLSAVTESQIIAAVLSFAALFITFMMSSICSLISASGNWFTKVLSVLDVATRFETFLNGTLDIRAVAYFVMVIVVMLFLTTQVIQKRRYNVSVKDFRMGAYSTAAIVVVIAAAVFLNLSIGRIPEKYILFDMTGNKLFSISEDTKIMLRALDKDVKIIVYSEESGFDTNISELLRRYEAESSHVSVEYLDPVTNPKLYKNYSNTQIASGSLIVQSGDKYRIINYEDLYQIEYSMDYTTYSYSENVTGIDAEGQITSAVAYVTGEEAHVIYFTSGHGEAELESSYTELITKANATMDTINLLTEEAVPDDADGLIIYAPTSDFNEEDMNKVREYVNRGGNVILAMPTTGEEEPVLYKFLEDYGLTVQNYVVADAGRGYYLQTPFYLLPNVTYSEYTSSVYDEYYVFAPYTLAMTVSETKPETSDITALLTSSDDSYAKPLTASLSSDEKEEGDLDGPFVVAAMVKVSNEDGSEGKILATGSAYLFSEAANSMVSGGNSKLFAEVISKYVSNDVVVAIPAKSYAISYLILTEADITTWRNIILMIIPGAILIIGFIVWFRRRKL